MNRGEVGLIVAKKGLDAGLMAPQFFTPVIILIIVSSLVTPIMLKLIYSKWPDKTSADGKKEDAEKLAGEQKVLSHEVVGSNL